MKLTTTLIGTAAIVTGLTGGLAAYETTAPDGRDEADSSAATSTLAAPASAAGSNRTRLAPCRPPSEREGDRCVIRVVRTVVLPGAVPPSPAVRAPTPLQPVTAYDDDHDEDGWRHSGDRHHGDDDADDDRDHDDVDLDDRDDHEDGDHDDDVDHHVDDVDWDDD
jgi:hypothetical protein